MRWPWQRRQQLEPESSSADLEEAARARRRAEEELRRAHAKTAEVRELADKLREHRRINHFAELFGKTFDRGPQ